MTQENPLKITQKVERLDKEYDLTIKNNMIDIYIEHLQQASDFDNRELPYLIKGENQDSVKDVLNILRLTKEEREVLITIMAGNEGTRFQNSKGDDLNILEIKASIEKIENALALNIKHLEQEKINQPKISTETVVEETKQEEIQTTENKPVKMTLNEVPAENPVEITVADEVKDYRHKSITNKIRDFQAQLLENKNNDELKKKIGDYIAEYTPKIQYRINEIKKEGESSNITDLENPELKSAIKNLNGLKKLEGSLSTENENHVKKLTFKKIKSVSAPTAAQIESLTPNAFTPGFGLVDRAEESTNKKESEEVVISEGEAGNENKYQDEEPYSLYDSLIRNIIANNDHNARIHFIHEHEALGKNLLQEIKNKKDSKEDAMVVDEFISKHQKNIKSLIDLVTAHGSEQGDVLLRILREDVDGLNKHKSTYINAEAKIEKEDGNDFKPSKKEKPEEKSFYYEHDDFDVVKKAINRDRRPLQTEAENPDEFKQEQSTQNPRPETREVVPAAKKPEPEIFTTEAGKDYGSIVEDKGFDTWLKNIIESVKRVGGSVESETQDIEAWYREYQESVPYGDKLNEISEDIKKTEGVDDIKLLMTEKKINDLLYKIHREGDAGREEINVIFKTYKDSKTKEFEIIKKKESEELRMSIGNERSRKNAENKELRSDQVKLILETRGAENTEENIEDMITFLQDMKNNYSFYSTKKEKAEFDDESFYNRYTASVGHRPNKGLGIFSKIISRLFASLPKNFDAVDFQNKTNLLKKVRDLNLVDRKDGKTETVVSNQTKMVRLIAFCQGQTGLLIEHVQNPKSNKEAVLDDEQKEMLELFDSMMKTFTESKYRGEDARLKAEQILKNMGSLSKSESETVESIKSTKEILFDDTEEIAIFEREAKAQVYREALAKLDSELGKFPKTGKDVKKLTDLDSRLNQIKKVLAEVGDEETDGLNLKKASLKIDELRLRHVNKDLYKELSENFSTYERIIMSSDAKKEDKITYINELLTALEKHRVNKTNTMIQNAVLNDTIEKYKKVLTSIK